MAGVFRNPKSGLVLDASQTAVKLEHFTGFPAQLWKIEPAGEGNYYIVNQGNGKVMDIQGGITKGANIITYQNHGGANQKWYINSDHTIVSSSGNMAVDIARENYQPGTQIIAYPKHGAANQLFYFQK